MSKNEVNEKGFGKKLTYVFAMLAAFGAGHFVGDVLDSDEIVVEEENDVDKPFESFGNFTDASNVELLNERADVYFEEFVNSAYGEMSKIEKDSVTKENLVDIMQVINGEMPMDFEVNEVINYNNKLVQIFTSYLSTDERTKNGNIGFIPSAYLFEDGSHEQKCATELDAVMQPLIKAINEGDDENYIKYATMFGELMRDQYYLVDNTNEHYNVRSIAAYPSRIQLYGLSYAYYTTSIMEYGLVRDINICIPFCIDYNTKEMVDVPLSKLMATLEFVPMSEWDAVIKRSGLTIKQLEQMGNMNVYDTMPYVFTQDAKNHFREKTLVLKK